MHYYMENEGKEIVEDDGYDEEAMLKRLDAGLPLDDFEMPNDFEDV